jgi:putative transposase
LLAEAATRYDCQVHAYVLMTNHVHLLVTQQSASGVSFLMQRTGQRYVRAINRQYRRSGTLWDGRYKAGLIDTEAYLLTCMRYIELNPVRARMVRHPAHYSWSSYHCNGEGKQDKLITPHTLYLQLGRDREARCRAYRDLCSTRIEADTLNAIRNTTQQELVLGSSPYRQQIERMLKRQTEARPRGRPRIKHSREY